MKESLFHKTFAALTPRQRQVLRGFLACESDETIANALVVEPSTVRRHLANIGKLFGLNNTEGTHYSYREELIELFKRYQPELVTPSFIDEVRSPLLTPEFPGTPLAFNSAFRLCHEPLETLCIQEISKPGALIRIHSPRKTGKTSLMHRLIRSAEELGYLTARVNFRQAEESVLSDLDAFLQWFCMNISYKLNLSAPNKNSAYTDKSMAEAGSRTSIEADLEATWDSRRFGSLVSCTLYFQSCILARSPQPILLALDEIDWLFEAPKIAQSFFALLRSWHEESNSLELWQQLRLVVVHSSEVYIPLDLHQSPFNVGVPIRLPLLQLDQVTVLSHQYGLHRLSQSELQQLIDFVGGHPYLIQLALYELHQEKLTFAELLETAPTQAGIYSSHLRYYWQMLQHHPDLSTALSQVLESSDGAILEPLQTYKLESMGLVDLQGNRAKISCALYHQYFCDRLMIDPNSLCRGQWH